MKEVTAALIIKDNKVLIARRAPGENLEGKWEFPGGKIEPGETPEDCLKREIQEELDVTVEVEGHFADSIYDYANGRIKLMAYRCVWSSGNFKLRVHSQINWVSFAELNQYDLAPADRPLAARLRAEGGLADQ